MSTTHTAEILRDKPAALMTVADLSRHLGISRWTVYRLVRNGEIRAVRVGERIRFRPVDVDAYLDRSSP